MININKHINVALTAVMFLNIECWGSNEDFIIHNGGGTLRSEESQIQDINTIMNILNIDQVPVTPTNKPCTTGLLNSPTKDRHLLGQNFSGIENVCRQLTFENCQDTEGTSSNNNQQAADPSPYGN